MAKRGRRLGNSYLPVSSVALAAGFGLVPEPARADCQFIFAIPPLFLCDGANTTPQSIITSSTADVRTASGFSVDTTVAGGGALTIRSDGPVKYIDTFASPLTSPETGLTIQSTGDSPLGPGSITVETAGAITGWFGIYAESGGGGTGSVDITATGPIVAAGGMGVHGVNSGGENLSILVGDVTAITSDPGNPAVRGTSLGHGWTRIESTGTVTSNITGIFAASGANSTDMTVIANNVAGEISAIAILNGGTGETRITTKGAISGTTLNGIYAYAGNGTGLTVESAGAHGGTTGIEVENNSGGLTRVAATGLVTGGSDMGIYAINRSTAADLTIEAIEVGGGVTGIDALNEGTGITQVSATGTVTGGQTGIIVENRSTGTDVTVEAVDVSGDLYGILAQNSGSGSTRVVATGDVASDGVSGEGIVVNSQAAGVDIQAFNTRGAGNGIRSRNQNSGETRIEVTGVAVGVSGNGIMAWNNAPATDMTITAASARGGYHGIQAINDGTGSTTIIANGLVEGGEAAIYVTSAGQPIDITTNGLVRNLSQLSSDLAIETAGGPVALENAGGMTGTVKFDAGAHNRINNATWNMAGGTNEFGGGTLANNTGMSIIGAAGEDIQETTVFNGLGSFTNHGLLTMMDGAAGDVIRQTGGDARFEPGAALAIDIDSTGQADLFTTSGTATLAGAMLSVNIADGIAYGSRYTVLTADGGVIGQFASLSGGASTAFLTMTDTYDATNVYLDVVKYRDFADAGLTPNQVATGQGLDSMPPSGELFDAVAGLASDAQARAAFDQLSGEVHASARGTLIEESRFVREAAIERLRSAFDTVGAAEPPILGYVSGGPDHRRSTDERFTVWGRAFGSWGHVDGDGNAARLGRSVGGLLVGGDALVSDSWRLGMLAGYSRTNLNVSDRGSSGAGDSYHLGLYSGTQSGDVALRAGAAYTWHDIETNRLVSFPGFSDSLEGEYDAGAAQAFGELAYELRMGGLDFEPFAKLAYVNLHTGGFDERGGAAALAGNGGSTDVTFSTLGLHASAEIMLGDVKAVVRGTLGWRHAFGDVTPTSVMAFAGGSPFTIASVPTAKNTAVVEAGLDLALSPEATLAVLYNGQFASGALDQSIKADFSWRF